MLARHCFNILLNSRHNSAHYTCIYMNSVGCSAHMVTLQDIGMHGWNVEDDLFPKNLKNWPLPENFRKWSPAWELRKVVSPHMLFRIPCSMKVIIQHEEDLNKLRLPRSIKCRNVFWWITARSGIPCTWDMFSTLGIVVLCHSAYTIWKDYMRCVLIRDWLLLSPPCQQE